MTREQAIEIVKSQEREYREAANAFESHQNPDVHEFGNFNREVSDALTLVLREIDEEPLP